MNGFRLLDSSISFKNLSGCWSRTIDDSLRLIYVVEDERIAIVACWYQHWLVL
ncbi:MAG TPA: hypothetical protein EYQ47_02500 [Cycloclasticus sp.]|nr:hypothetical protein [Cycloclasticus sp.]